MTEWIHFSFMIFVAGPEHKCLYLSKRWVWFFLLYLLLTFPTFQIMRQVVKKFERCSDHFWTKGVEGTDLLGLPGQWAGIAVRQSRREVKSPRGKLAARPRSYFSIMGPTKYVIQRRWEGTGPFWTFLLKCR